MTSLIERVLEYENNIYNQIGKQNCKQGEKNQKCDLTNEFENIKRQKKEK